MARFNDSITVAEIRAGIETTIRNMEGLAAAARTLAAAGNYGPCFGLSVMSLEESGKLHVLRAMCQRGAVPGTSWRQLWSSFRSHGYKSSAGLMDCYSDDSRDCPEKVLELATQHEATADQVEAARQWSFYADFDAEHRNWNSPADFDEGTAREALAQAETALQRARNQLAAGLFSLEALELLRDVYEPFFRELLANTEPTSALDVANAAIPYHHEFFRRLKSESILDPDSGIDLLL